MAGHSQPVQLGAPFDRLGVVALVRFGGVPGLVKRRQAGQDVGAVLYPGAFGVVHYCVSLSQVGLGCLEVASIRARGQDVSEIARGVQRCRR